MERLKRLRKLASIATVTEQILDAAISSPHADFPKGTLRVAEPLEYLSSETS